MISGVQFGSLDQLDVDLIVFLFVGIDGVLVMFLSERAVEWVSVEVEPPEESWFSSADEFARFMSPTAGEAALDAIYTPVWRRMGACVLVSDPRPVAADAYEKGFSVVWARDDLPSDLPIH